MAIRNKIKARKARVEADRNRVEQILRRYGGGGTEVRQIALIAELDSTYVTRLLIALREMQRAESWYVEETRRNRWRGVGSATADDPPPCARWTRDVPLKSLDEEHQEWTRRALMPKVKFNPFGGER